jgi:hypothetical protein
MNDSIPSFLMSEDEKEAAKVLKANKKEVYEYTKTSIAQGIDSLPKSQVSIFNRT